MQQQEEDILRDHCGVVGIYGHPEAAKLTYLALYALQHRGQDSAGIVSVDEGGTFHRSVGLGLVSDVFDEATLHKLPGLLSIGHVRYTTAGGADIHNAQPLVVKTALGFLSTAHNGNFTNAETQRTSLENKGALFQTDSDTEILCHLFAHRTENDWLQRLLGALNEIKGAFSLCLLMENRLIGVRDSHGVRPLFIGKLKQGFVLSSEDCAFGLIEAECIREVRPGELLVIDEKGISSYSLSDAPPKEAACIFEHVYFSRPDSHVFGSSVHASRRKMGRRLAQEAPAKADVVIPVPDSGLIAALGFSEESQIPFEMGLVRNHYVGRTFIEPESGIRHFGVRLKLSPVAEVIRGRRLVVIDDSLVRGTTSKKIVTLLKMAGAKEIHLRICAPPTTHSCFYGIDTPSREELIAAQKSIAEIQAFLGVDTLAYLSLDGLHAAVDGTNQKGFCDACFSGNYPIQIGEP